MGEVATFWLFYTIATTNRKINEKIFPFLSFELCHTFDGDWVYPKGMVATFSFFQRKENETLNFNAVIKGSDGARMWLRPYPQHHPHPPRLHTR